MEEIIEKILHVWPIILPILTGYISFFITKYQYNNNKPLDKLEIAYNRVYYPILKIVVEKDKVDNEIIIKCNQYILKYYKYVDVSTRSCFEYLKDNTLDNKAYHNFKNNIINKNRYLRNRLGYLMPEFGDLYKYAPRTEKKNCRLLLEIIFLYVFIWSYKYISHNQIFVVLFSVCLIIIFIELFFFAIDFVISMYKKYKNK